MAGLAVRPSESRTGRCRSSLLPRSSRGTTTWRSTSADPSCRPGRRRTPNGCCGHPAGSRSGNAASTVCGRRSSRASQGRWACRPGTNRRFSTSCGVSCGSLPGLPPYARRTLRISQRGRDIREAARPGSRARTVGVRGPSRGVRLSAVRPRREGGSASRRRFRRSSRGGTSRDPGRLSRADRARVRDLGGASEPADRAGRTWRRSCEVGAGQLGEVAVEPMLKGFRVAGRPTRPSSRTTC